MTATTRLDDDALDLIFREARTYSGWSDRAVDDATLREAVELTKMAPTSVNCSPLRIVFVRSAEAKAKLKDALSPGNVDKTMAAPVTAILAWDPAFFEALPKLFPHADARSWFVGNAAFAEATARLNSALQVGYFILALRSVGLDAGPMTGFDAAKVDAAFFADGSARASVLVNIGYGDASKLFPRSPRFAYEEIATTV
jgi:3-hydroxypropanoate dehydrogenase